MIGIYQELNEYTRNPVSTKVERQIKCNDLIDSDLVYVKENERCHISMQYPLRGFKHAEKRCMARREANAMLERAEKLLPDDLKFVIWDAWRPLELQEELYHSYESRIIERFQLQNMPERERRKIIAEFVAEPDEKCPPGHSTGGAFDLTIMNKDGKLLDMGTEFDSFCPETYAEYYEKILDGRLPFPKDIAKEDAVRIRNNRRLLWNIMTSCGFTSINSEWWHFDFGNRNWASRTGMPVRYDIYRSKKLLG